MSLPLVLIPGLMCDARLYGPQIAALSGRVPLHFAPIHAHDDIPALARHVLANAPPEFALGGLSMGGMVAMEIVAQAPDRVAKLALLATDAKPDGERIRDLRAAQIARVRAGELRSVLTEEWHPHFLAEGSERTGILDLCLEMALALGPEVFARQAAALAGRADRQDVLRGYAGETLVLCGADDRLCPVRRHELMYELLPNAELMIVDGAGHLPTLETPDQVNDALRDWLAG